MTSSSKPPRTAPLLFLLVTAFLFSVGVGLVFPVLPFIVETYVPQAAGQAAVVGLLGAVYALCSFFASPVLGALSDTLGRRPVLMLSLLGSGIGDLIFGLGGGLWVLFLGRVIDGLCAGGLSALFGYVADTTAEEDRGRVFGQIGATVGLGFILGPALGGLASHLSLNAPMFLAAGVALLNLLWGAFILPESLPVAGRRTQFDASQLNPLRQLRAALSVPAVRRLVWVSVLFSLPFTVMQVTLALLGQDALGWGPAQISTVFMLVGLCDMVAQGVVLPFLLRALGELGVARLGLTLGVIGMVGLALLPVWPLAAVLYVSVVIFTLGEGLFTAAQSAVISVAAPGSAQGQAQGGAQALGQLAQVIGPFGGGQLYSRLGPAATFGTGAVLVLAALGLLLGQGPAGSTRAHTG